MIGILGINHKTAPLEIREHFAISQDEISLFAEELQKQANFSDMVVISTCNRTEIYYSQNMYHGIKANTLLFNCLMSFKKIDFSAEKHFYSYYNEDAVSHLFQVTSGIDSMVIGEDQIIGQVKDAYVFCTEKALTDAVLMRLFQKSFEAGKKVRTKTAIKMGATSVSYLAIDMCELEFGNLQNLSVLMVGTGDTGSLALQGLYKKGIRSFLISNRTTENAAQLVSKYNAEFITLDSLEDNLHKADIIIVATGAQEPIILSSMVLKSMKIRKSNRQFYVDLSVPRNIENFGLAIPGARLIGVDDLEVVIDANKEKRAACIEEGTEIIDEVVTEFMEWLSFRNLQPAIRSIKFQLEKIFRDELVLYSKEIPEEERVIIQKFNEQLIQKYSRKIITNLKSVTDNGKKEKYLKIINQLFKKA